MRIDVMTVVPVLKRELKTYFTSPIMYAVVSVFLILSGYFFYTNLVMYVLFAGSGVNIDLWEYTFNDVSYILLLLLPLISMRLFAEEKKLGTFELLVTAPLRDTDILLGKYCAGLIIIATMLILSLLYPLILSAIHVVFVPALVPGYMGLFLIGASFLACGIFLSSLTEQQIVAAISTAGLLMFLWFIDRSEDIATPFVAGVLQQVSLFRHFFNFARGVIDTKDIIYFVSVIAAGLLLTLFSIQSRQWKGFARRTADMRLLLPQGVILSLLIVLLPVNVIARLYNYRFDFTFEKKYTLSEPLRNALASVKDTFDMTVRVTKEQKRPVQDYLELLQTNCQHLRYKCIDVDKNAASPDALKGLGNTGGVATYKGRKENFVTLSDEEVLKTIYALAYGREKIACFIIGHGERDLSRTAADGFSEAQAALQSDSFTITPLRLDDPPGMPSDCRMVIIAGPQQDFSDRSLAHLENYFERGGQLLLLLDPAPLPRLKKFLARYNVEVGTDIVVDRSNPLAEADDLTPIIFINREHPIASHLTAAVLFPKTCSVQVGTHPLPGFSWEILAQSGKETWAEQDLQSAFDNTAQYQEGTDLRGPVQVAVITKKAPDKKHEAPEGRMVVMGTSQFATNQHINILGNRDFFLNCVRWLAEVPLPEIVRSQPRDSRVPPLVSLTAAESRLVFWSCVIMQPALILAIGIGVIFRRRFLS